ncbi:MAG: hypothetical protein PVG12_13010, partial [Gammaproteobacteria bacterium]
IIAILALVLVPVSHAFPSEQHVITDDGREVLLRQDGTWKFRSNDRFANTEDGQRVRLKQDGSWEYVGNAPMVMDEHVRTTELDIKLQQVVIERHEEKAQKNKRVISQTVFYVDLALSPVAENNISISKEDSALVKVRDNKGKDYPVIAIKPAASILEPGSKTTVAVRVYGSPQWWKNIKTMEVRFHPGMFGTAQPVSLSRRVADIVKKDVDGFEQSD